MKLNIASLPAVKLLKSRFLGIPVFLLAIILSLSSCMKDEVETEQTYTVYEPVNVSLAEVRSAFTVMQPKPLETPGKIYIYGKYLLVNEVKKGLHVFDNSNPAAPYNIAFLNIPGNMDIAVKDNILYADNYMDLLALDISYPVNARIISRMEEAIPGFMKNADGTYIVDYVEKKVTVKTKGEYHGSGRNGSDVDFNGMEMTALSGSNMSAGNKGGQSAPGIGGSMARFTISGNNLYIVDQSSLHHFNISSPNTPVKGNTTSLGWGIETIFPYADKLFIGSQAGMFIYSISNPSTPTYISQYNHVSSCDPVVVEGDYAYVTLRSGTKCQGFTNQLDVIDIKNIQQPKLLKTYPMTNPHGLGIDNGTLFISDGSDGLKVYNANDPEKISDNRLGHYKDFDGYDVIPYNKNLIMVGKDGIKQYDYSDPEKLKLLSTIFVARK